MIAVNSRVKVRGKWGTWLVIETNTSGAGQICAVIPADREAAREDRPRLVVPVEALEC